MILGQEEHIIGAVFCAIFPLVSEEMHMWQIPKIKILYV